MSGEAHYLLGHTEHELRRLELQGELYREVTADGFARAGIGAGMRVLDLGCGTGDVSRVAARLVGPGGQVLGIDRGADAVRAATGITSAMAVANVTFVVTEIEAFEDADGFDALVGRFVLMHQERPAEVLRRAARLVRPGGVICFVESYMNALLTGGHSFPHSALYDEMVRWKSAVVGGAGADLHAGARLRETFVAAGLPAPETHMHARLEGGAESPYYEYMAHSVRSMQPEALRLGLGGLVDADPDELERRLRQEVVDGRGVLVAWPVVVAHTRTPGDG